MTTATARIALDRSLRSAAGAELDAAVSGFAASVVRLDGLDPVLTEIVRLRCARVHDCRLCQSLRTTTAIEAGFDESMEAKIDQYETSDLDERTKAALRFTDAVITSPGQVSPDLRAALRANFTDAQIAELAFDVLKWSQQKVHVALRLETPPRDGLTELSFDADGNAHYGAAMADR